MEPLVERGHPAAHGAIGHSQHQGDLRLGHLVEAPHDEQLQVVAAEPPRQLLDQLPRGERAVVRGRLLLRVDGLHLVGGTRRAQPQPIDREVRAGPVDPGDDLLRRASVEVGAPEADEGLLRQVLRLVSVGEHAAALGADHRKVEPVDAVDLGERQDEETCLQGCRLNPGRSSAPDPDDKKSRGLSGET